VLRALGAATRREAPGIRRGADISALDSDDWSPAQGDKKSEAQSEAVNRDGFRVDQCSTKSSYPCRISATVALHETVEFDYFGAPAGT
jgi:hypothetical protein